MSTRTGVAPERSIACTVEQKVIAVVMTESPGLILSAANATSSAAVQELTARADGAPTAWANSDSNRFTLGPVVIQSERRVSATSAISASPINGGENGKKALRMDCDRRERKQLLAVRLRTILFQQA